MRMMIAVALLVAGCAQTDTSYQQAKTLYLACLGAKPISQCTTEKARLDVEAQSLRLENERDAARPPLVLSGPAQRRGMTCTTIGAITTCD